jgi:calcium-dependent protein kinase
MTERCGTTPYAAPEVLRKSYDARCDIWSLGMILYFMLTGEHPLQQHVKDEQSLENLLRNGSIPYSKRLWKALPESAKLLTQRMLTADLKKRATLDQIAEMLDQGCLNTSH